MPAAPLIVALLVVLATAVGAAGLGISPAPLADGAAILATAGLVIAGLVAVAGVLLARSRWSRWLAAGVAATWVGIGTTQSSRWGMATAAVAAVALAGVAGPWLARWLRRRPTADGPPPAAVVALLGLVATPAALALALADGVPAAGWMLGVWSPVAALAIGRAWPGALAIGRVLHPLVAAACGVLLPLPGMAVALGSAAVVSGATWRRDVAVAIAPVVPVTGAAVRFPPELTPPEILEAAGLDETGRRRTP